MAPKKKATPAVAVAPPPDPNPLLMSVLLEAKGALFDAQTPQAFLVIKKIQELEFSLPAKTTWTAAAVNQAKALAQKQSAGGAVHPEEVQELLGRFASL